MTITELLRWCEKEDKNIVHLSVCLCQYYKYLQLVKSLILAFVLLFIVNFKVLRCTHEYISKALSTYLSILNANNLAPPLLLLFLGQN